VLSLSTQTSASSHKGNMEPTPGPRLGPEDPWAVCCVSRKQSRTADLLDSLGPETGATVCMYAFP
jgi:hypothetical protein